ncbi:MAG: DUF5343 domain-containing protein [Solirubrobacteraceae bacterium]|nr:DUF5343 domain-containing protein [Solirubrobacteraceae bacterium]
MTAHGNIKKVLDKVTSAETPPRFTQDYLATTLDMPGGSAKPVIPFLKRTGFLGSDGVPTELYRRFRNNAQRGAAAAEALRIGYKPLYAVNEYIHDAKDPDLRGVILQVTGLSEDSTSLAPTVGSFKALRAYADFSAAGHDAEPELHNDANGGDVGTSADASALGLSLGYTINLHLPATSDVAVFSAIFKSLREHLLR